MLKTKLKNMKGITLIALVITIIVLLILAAVSIAMLTGENGILTQAQRAKKETEKSQTNEQSILDSYEDYMNGTTGGQWEEDKGVNSPQILTGMTKVSFNLPSTTTKGKVIKEGETGFDENNWYNYEASEWANVITQDGSYWVWIPRYAYKITYKNKANISEGGTIDVKFLIGTTDQYYDDEGNLKTAKRVTSKDEAIDTSTDYYVHPAFTDESSIDYANGGWDEELAGIWVAKFEAGYASKNNSAQVFASNVNYSQSQIWSSDGWTDAENCLDGVYGSTATSIKYPTFQPITYSMNYININDAYNISKVLTDNGNIYGLSSLSTDSHLIKNSEWGAVVYLAWSQYGTKGQEPYMNNINVNNNIQSVYAVTGLTTGETGADAKETTEADLENINNRSGNNNISGIYAWDQLTGQKASSTLNMYGIYDLSGGVWERTAGYTNNEHEYLNEYGASVVVGGPTSTKYTTVYPYQSPENSNYDTASEENYKLNNYIFGDAIRETSTSGTGSNSWNGDYSIFLGTRYPFTFRGGRFGNNSSTGLFAFNRTDGAGVSDYGFRSVLVAL